MGKFTLSMGAVLLVFMLGPPGNARAGTVQLTLNDGGNYIMGNTYVGPYNFTMNGQPTQLVCDDFADDVSAGETWNATASTFNSLTNVQFKSGYLDNGNTNISQLQAYEEAGWLYEQSINPQNSGNGTAVGELQWALWDIFYPGASTSSGSGVSSQYWAGISADLSAAEADYGSGNYSNLVIYSALNGYTSCPSGGCSERPQEYFATMPEPMTLWSLLTVLAAIALAYKWVDKTKVESSASAGG